MAFLEIKNVKLTGVAAAVPGHTISNSSHLQESREFIESTGIFERRHSEQYTSSDLCVEAADKLIKELKWEKEDIDGILFVSQYRDYILPATACIIQERLGLSKECFAEDISMGCSGWVYGLSTAAALLQNGSIKKMILLCGDAKRSTPVNDPLFGHAGTATALEYDNGNEGFKFHFGTDGSNFEAIIIPDGGARNQTSLNSFSEEMVDGKKLHRLQTRMKGMDVFSFGITVPPKSIKSLSNHFNEDYSETDYLILHQANKKILEMIGKKLKLPSEKIPSSLYNYGNTSSASIPLTIVSQLRDHVRDNSCKFVCCGFGVGLSWGSVMFKTEKLVIPELVECKLD